MEQDSGKPIEQIGSQDVARAAVLMCMTRDREEERQMTARLTGEGYCAAAVNHGGELISSVMKIVERAVVAAKREGVIEPVHHEEGAVAGATREAISQIMPKAVGLNVGGKIGIARRDEHIAVAIFFGIGLLHLNEVSIGLGHRVI